MISLLEESAVIGHVGRMSVEVLPFNFLRLPACILPSIGLWPDCFFLSFPVSFLSFPVSSFLLYWKKPWFLPVSSCVLPVLPCFFLFHLEPWLHMLHSWYFSSSISESHNLSCPKNRHIHACVQKIMVCIRPILCFQA